MDVFKEYKNDLKLDGVFYQIKLSDNRVIPAIYSRDIHGEYKFFSNFLKDEDFITHYRPFIKK